MFLRSCFLLCLCLLLPLSAVAQNNGTARVGEYEIFYNLLPTSFLHPQVAEGYGIVRSRGHGLLRITVIRHLPDGHTQAVDARVDGQMSSLTGQIQGLSFRTLRVAGDEGFPSVAVFRFSHDDPMRFNLRVHYAAGQPPHELNFIGRLYMD